MIATVLLASAHWLIILLYSNAYLRSIQPFQILLIGVVGISGWKVLENDLKGQGKPMLNTYVVALSLVLNIILNIVWIPKFGILGVAWATSISYTMVLLITLIIYSKVSSNRIIDIILIKKADLKLYYNLYITFKGRLKLK